MNELLECKDLRLNKRVIIAYWELLGEKSTLPIKRCECDDCRTQRWDTDPVIELRPIPGSLADVAFVMRDALTRDQRVAWRYHLRTIYGSDECSLEEATAMEQIIAATLAWEATK